MKKYWTMKTFKSWWDIFHRDNIIGIDQEGVTKNYNTLIDIEIQQLLSDATLEDRYTEHKDRIFREFCKWMHKGDLVIIGTGQMTKFNLSGIARVSGEYCFDLNREPKHFRKIEMLRSFNKPHSMQRFSRTSRLELIDETDFLESIIKIIPNPDF